jgi:flagellar protein FliO/FliZ
MDQLLLGIRVVVSLAIVIGLMWAISRMTKGRTPVKGVPLEVVSRAAVGRKASVVVIHVAGRGLVVGVTESSMALLAEIEVEAAPAVAETRTPVDLSAALLGASASEGHVDAGGTAVAAFAAIGETDVPRRGTGRRAAPDGATPLSGSVLSPQTWRDMAVALREKSVRT